MVIGVFLTGLIVGSFLNVLALRFGYHESARSRSACMACGVPLTALDLIPVVSFVALRGRCRTCGSRFSLQYPVIELLTGFLFLGVFLSTPLGGVPLVWLQSVALLVFWSAFILILVVDVKHTLVPLPFAWILIGGAMAVRLCSTVLLSSAMPFSDALAGGMTLASAVLFLVFITRGKGMGEGDIYIAAALGILFGFWRGIEVIAMAFWIGAIVGIALIALSRRVTMKTELPFAPFLFMAAVIGAFTAFSPFAWIAHLF